MSRLIDLLWQIGDLFFPLPQQLSREQEKLESDKLTEERAKVKERLEALANDELSLSRCLDECTQLIERERSRRQSVEARLTTVMGLSSIAGTIVFGTILTQAMGGLHTENPSLRWIMIFGETYLMLQLCSAILAAIRGLSRQSVIHPADLSILPIPKDSKSSFLTRRITECFQALADHRSKTNLKVTQMATAHRAMANFLGGLLLLAVGGLYFAYAAKPQNEFVEILKKNREIQELLRGPQGPPGEPCSAIIPEGAKPPRKNTK